jgi:hypothetical protein
LNNTERIATDLTEAYHEEANIYSVHSFLRDRIFTLERELFDIKNKLKQELVIQESDLRTLLLIRQLVYSYQFKAASFLEIGNPNRRYMFTHQSIALHESANQTKLRMVEDLFDPTFTSIDVEILVRQIREVRIIFNQSIPESQR